MGKKKSRPYKKTNEMVLKYKQNLKKPNVGMEDTINNSISNLECSDIPSEVKLDNIPVQGKSIWLKITDWFKENWISTLLIGSIIVLFEWGIDTKVNMTEIKTRLEYINEIVINLDDSYSRKEEVKIEIENIKSLIDANGYKNVNDIKERVDKLEKLVNE